MSVVRRLAEEIKVVLKEATPGLRKTVQEKLSLTVAALIETRTPNTSELASKLPLKTERADMREQWLRRLLCSPAWTSEQVLEAFGRKALQIAGERGQTIALLMDQTDLGNRFAILMVSVRVGERALPLAWHVEEGQANIGFEQQHNLLEQVKKWLPPEAAVLLLADRFYGSASLFHYVEEVKWSYRLRLKGNFSVDTGQGDLTTVAQLARGYRERYVPCVTLFEEAIPTHIGILHETGHKEPWIIAMNCQPNRARVLDYGLRWGIEPMFSDFKSRGFALEDTHLTHALRLDRLLAIMALALHWCVQVGRLDALLCPTYIEKKHSNRSRNTIGASKKCYAAVCLGSLGACAKSYVAPKWTSPYLTSASL